MPRHSSSASRPPSPWSAGPVTGSSQARTRSSRPSGRRPSSQSRPLCYRAATDANQPRAAPAPSTRSRPATARTPRLDARHRRGRHRRRPVRRVARDCRRRVGVRRGGLQPLRGRPARPRPGAPGHPVRPADRHLRPHRQGRAGPPGRPQARDRHLRRSDPGDHRRHHRDRGQGLLDQRRVRPGRHHLGRARYGQRPAARRLDDHPAAGPGTAAAARRVRGLHLRAQVPRDHPVHPADPGVPGRRGQAADHHGLPEPELLRQPELRRRRPPPGATSASRWPS